MDQAILYVLCECKNTNKYNKTNKNKKNFFVGNFCEHFIEKQWE